jgi:hypothetical protein
MSQPDPDARLYAAERAIALIGATGYMQTQFPAAQLEWGDRNAPPTPDDIDQVWREAGGGADGGDRWFAVTAVSGTYGPQERAYSWGQRVLAGTREYLRFAIERLSEHGHKELAGSLEAEMLGSRLVYLELTTVGESVETMEVRARQYDISDETMVASMLAAVHEQDSNRIERLRQPLGTGAADALAAAYWTLSGWYEKALLARFAHDTRDRSHAGLGAVFADLLAIPDEPANSLGGGDTAREARTFALTWLDGDEDGDSFVRLYEDEDAQAAGIARYLGGG